MHPFIPSATPSVFTMFDLFRPAKEKRGAELCDGSPFDRLQFYVAAPVGLGGFLERLDSKEKREISDGCTPERNFSGSMKPAEEEGRFEEQIPFFPNMHVARHAGTLSFERVAPRRSKRTNWPRPHVASHRPKGSESFRFGKSTTSGSLRRDTPAVRFVL